MNPNRRDFIAFSAAALATPLVKPAAAIEPIRRAGGPHMRLSLAGYSFRQKLDLKKPTWTYFDFIDFAAAQQIDAVEFTEYFFDGTSPEYLAKLKLNCTRLGLDVNGTAIRNDFCLKDAEALKKQMDHVNAWTERTVALGGKTMRIFAGTMPKGDREEDARRRAVECIEKCCEYSKKVGVYLALENHHGIVASADQMLSIVTAVRSDYFGVNLDTGNFSTKDPYADLTRVAPYAVTVQVKTEVKPEGKPAEEADLPRKIKMLRDANYRGYVVLEYEAKEDATTAVPKYLKELRKLIG